MAHLSGESPTDGAGGPDGGDIHRVAGLHRSGAGHNQSHLRLWLRTCLPADGCAARRRLHRIVRD
ncbi:hypothetical protein J2T18_000734 [Paenibacillus polymyxa]|nr:hypothetical protein [Paenibacillus polymyxa]